MTTYNNWWQEPPCPYLTMHTLKTILPELKTPLFYIWDRKFFRSKNHQLEWWAAGWTCYICYYRCIIRFIAALRCFVVKCSKMMVLFKRILIKFHWSQTHPTNQTSCGWPSKKHSKTPKSKWLLEVNIANASGPEWKFGTCVPCLLGFFWGQTFVKLGQLEICWTWKKHDSQKKTLDG